MNERILFTLVAALALTALLAGSASAQTPLLLHDFPEGNQTWGGWQWGDDDPGDILTVTEHPLDGENGTVEIEASFQQWGVGFAEYPAELDFDLSPYFNENYALQITAQLGANNQNNPVFQINFYDTNDNQLVFDFSTFPANDSSMTTWRMAKNNLATPQWVPPGDPFDPSLFAGFEIWGSWATGPPDEITPHIIIDKLEIVEAENRVFGPGSADTGNHQVGIWEASGRTTPTSLRWTGDVDSILYEFDGPGGAIGSVGRAAFATPGWPIRVDDTDSSPLNIDAEISYEGDGAYYFGVYGWVLSDPSWDDADVKHEFYVIQETTEPDEDPLIGTLTVDGVAYNMHRHSFQEHEGFRFKAIRSTDPIHTGPVDMTPFFDYWRNHEMENGYLTSLDWMIELLGGANHTGTFSATNIVIPTYLTAGDFDFDGDVDGDDFLIWQASFNNTDGGDADADGDTDGDDFLIWQSNFGSGGNSAAALPEPSSLLLSVLVVVGLLAASRR